MSGFPPGSERTAEIQRMVQLLESVIDESAVYLSSPITTGRRYVDWVLRSPNEADATCQEVVERNSRDAARLAAELRKTFRFVIDPSSLKEIASWKQDDFRVLWATVIKTFASMVILQDKWEFSNGCAYEFLTAHQANIPVLNAQFEPVSLQHGLVLLRAAIEELESRQLSTAFLAQVAAHLEAMALNVK